MEYRMFRTRFVPVPRNWQNLKTHPLSAIVEFGEGIDLETLAEFMRQHGYDPDEPIIIHDGMVLDGRHRHAAAIMAGVVPSFKALSEGNATAYVGKKIHRQHLSTAQRAKLAHALTQISIPTLSAGTPNGGAPSHKGLISQDEAAKVLNVSKRSVQRAAAEANGHAPRNGAVLFDWKVFDAQFGKVVQQIDNLGKAYHCKESPEAEGLRRKLSEFRAEFKAWYKAAAKQTAPE